MSIRYFRIFFLLGALLPASFVSAEETAYQDSYAIQPGDLLRISVWGEEALVADTPVRPDGFISFPLADDVPAAGHTVAELRAALTEKLKKYVPDPVVTVMTTELRGNTVFVIGKVNRPGPFPVQRPTDVVQALSMAGGMTPYAAAGKIRILRRDAQGQQQAIPFDYSDIEKGKDLKQNIVLQPGDVVVVP